MGSLGKIFVEISFFFCSETLDLEMTDTQQLLRLIDPTSFGLDSENILDEGLLQMKLDEPIKLQLCYVLQHLCSYQLQYRIEGTIAFSEDFVGRLQAVSSFEENLMKIFEC